MSEYNKTQLNPETTFERHVFHRDQFAHYLRWSHVLNIAKIGQKILDVGCGSGNLLEVFYRNRYKPNKYLGIDIRKQTMDKANQQYEKLDFAEFKTVDIAKEYDLENKDWDIITSFEVIEHINKKNADQFLLNIQKHCNENTIVLISTPVYDEKVGAAANHIYDGQVQEFGYDELKELLEKYFNIDDVFGTFASQKDYKHLMSETELKHFEKMKKYYDSNLVSVLFAPLYPKQSRNCLWRLSLKK